MSLESWKEEFYPVPADTEMSTREAILHSIKKWEGLLPENLNKHSLALDGKFVLGIGVSIESIFYDVNSYLIISGESCALCVKFYSNINDDDDESCDACPLFHVSESPCGPGTSYGYFVETGNPQPMIDDLRRALNMFDLGYTE